MDLIRVSINQYRHHNLHHHRCRRHPQPSFSSSSSPSSSPYLRPNNPLKPAQQTESQPELKAFKLSKNQKKKKKKEQKKNIVTVKFCSSCSKKKKNAVLSFFKKMSFSFCFLAKLRSNPQTPHGPSPRPSPPLDLFFLRVAVHHHHHHRWSSSVAKGNSGRKPRRRV